MLEMCLEMSKISWLNKSTIRSSRLYTYTISLLRHLWFVDSSVEEDINALEPFCNFFQTCQISIHSQIVTAMYARHDLYMKGFVLHETSNCVALDDHRQCAPVPDTTALALTELLKRLAGALKQPVRREFAPVVGEASLDVRSVPGSLNVTTQDNTFFYGYGWNHHVGVESKHQPIQLSTGGMVLFRSDFIYARAGSTSNDISIHTFLPPFTSGLCSMCLGWWLC
ncbi:hypothetical protein GQ600_5020 [Phytophthora cactorum]|nr:hypothetical protein GQ600_5020 [Phytophthora cactorum]